MCQDNLDENVVEHVAGPKFGIVECDKLVIRNHPDVNADILRIIDKDCEVMIDESNSTEEFYFVCTASGSEGYCMKQFIAVR